MTDRKLVHTFSASGRLRTLAILTGVAFSASLLATTPAHAQLTPTNTLQNPATGPNNFATEPLSDYDSDAYSELIAGPTSSAASNAYIGANVLSWVYRDPTDGTMAFVYQFVNSSSGSPNDVARLTLNGTATGTVSGGAITGGTTVNATSPIWEPFTINAAGADGTGLSTATGSPSWSNGNPYFLQQDGSNFGIVIQFDGFNSSTFGPLGTLLDSPDNYSAEIWFVTSAKNYQLTNVGISDTSTTGGAFAYGPAMGTFVVPEPSAILLALASAAALLWFVRRRKLPVQLAA